MKNNDLHLLNKMKVLLCEKSDKVISKNSIRKIPDNSLKRIKPEYNYESEIKEIETIIDKQSYLTSLLNEILSLIKLER